MSDRRTEHVIALPSSVDCAVALAERSAENEALRAENDRVAGLYLAAQAERAQAEIDASHAHSGWAQERAANRQLREERSGARSELIRLALEAITAADETTRLRATARALYRHAAGESVDADALDAAMCHGREIDEAATAAEASDDNG